MPNTKKIDRGYWLDQIHSGIRFREQEASEDKWDIWRDYYRGEWADGVLPLNFFFSLLRALVPKVYFKNPSVSIVPTLPGDEYAIFSQLLERIDNKLLHAMKIKRQIKLMIQDTFLYGTCFGKLGYGSEFAPTPGDLETKRAHSKKFGFLEYNSTVMDNMPWFKRVHPKYIILPWKCESVEATPWIAHEVSRPYDDVMADKRFKNKKDLKPTKMVRFENSSGSYSFNNPVDMLRLFEVRDKKYKRVFIISPDCGGVLYEGRDELQTSVGLPIFSAVFNPDPEYCWGVPDARIIEPQQLEINEIRTQMMKHRRASLVKILAETNSISEIEAEKLLSEDGGSVIFAKEMNKVKPFQIANIPQDLYATDRVIHSDVREQIGFSRNQMGDTSTSRTTAHEAEIARSSSEIRVDERRDIIADVIEDVVISSHEVVFKYWEEEQVVDVMGPGGVQLWVKFRGEMLKSGAYRVKVDPDSATPMSRQNRESKAMQVYNIFKENPMIDPMALTKHLLREMHGVEYDNLMRGIPQGAGTTQPMDMGQYKQMMGNARQMGMGVPKPGQQKQVAGGK